MKILWLKDSKTGHLHKAKGLLRALAERTEIQLTEYEVQWRWSGLRAVLSGLGSFSLRLPLSLFLRQLPDLSEIDLILSAGGSTQWPNAAIARKTGACNVFLGSPRHMSPELFSIIAYHDAPSRSYPFFRFEIIPSMITPALAGTAAAQANLIDHPAWGLLIGGDGENITWSEADYLALAKDFLSIARGNQARVRIATSRRTPRHIESMLRALFTESGMLAESCWYHQREPGAPSLIAMMGSCARLFVTADSMSMTHEAVSSGRPVHVIVPRQGGNKRLNQNLAQLEKHRHILPLPIDCMLDGKLAPDEGWDLLVNDPSSDLATAVLDVFRINTSPRNHTSTKK